MLVACWQNSWLKVELVETKKSDLLYVKCKAYNTSIYFMLLCSSIPSKPEDKARNQEMRKETETVIEEKEVENEAIILLGD